MLWLCLQERSYYVFYRKKVTLIIVSYSVNTLPEICNPSEKIYIPVALDSSKHWPKLVGASEK